MYYLKIKKKILLTLLTALPIAAYAQETVKLTGTVIGTEQSVDYSKGQASTTVNTKANAFDGNLETFFASYDRSMTWAGLDLGKKHVITRVGWAPRNDQNYGAKRVQLAVFEGANKADFSDAVPLYLNDKTGTIGKMDYADVNVSRGFRYVRYVGPNDARCNVAELEFYGYEGEGDDSQMYRPTNLPLVVIQVENANEPYDKEHDLNCMITLIPAKSKDEVETKEATVRLRGNNSMTHPKKPYRIKFAKKQKVFGSPAKAKKWTLINNYGDKTLMRNILAFETSRRVGLDYTPFCQPVDVIVNGEYKGCYQLCDQMEVNENRIDIEEMEPTDISGEALTGGYLLEIDAYADQEPSWFRSNRGIPVTIKSPDSDDITTEQSNYIKNFWNNSESLVYNRNYSGSNDYRTRYDITSFLKHFIVGEFSGNTDTYWSVYVYKRRNEDLFRFGPVWDFDLAFENDYRTHPINEKTDYIYTYGSKAGDMGTFVDRIIKNDSRTSADLLNVWKTARTEGKLTPESMLDFVDETAKLLDQSQRLNFLRWPILDQWVHMNWQASGSYEAEVNIVKNYITERFKWLDKKIGYDDTSGIVETPVTEEAADGAIYTIDGRNLGKDAKNLPKGIYIRNGRKVVVK